MPKGSERVEYRVVGENRDGPWEGRRRTDLALVKREARRLSAPGLRPNRNVRIETRTVIETPWTEHKEATNDQ